MLLSYRTTHRSVVFKDGAPSAFTLSFLSLLPLASLLACSFSRPTHLPIMAHDSSVGRSFRDLSFASSVVRSHLPPGTLRTLPTLRRSGLPFVSLSHSSSQSFLELPSRVEFEDLRRARHVTLRGRPEACLPTHPPNLTSRFECFRVISPHRQITSVIGSTSRFVVPNRSRRVIITTKAGN